LIHHLPVSCLQESPSLYEVVPRINNFTEVTEKKRLSVEENLNHTPLGLDELSRQCQISTEELLCIILELEMAGRVVRSAGNQIALITP
jgi:DNA processing protein